MSQVIQNYRVLYREGVELPYLVILYKDTLGKPRTPPATFYGFQVEHGSALMKKDHPPIEVKNIHGISVYQSYLARGWKDITQVDSLLPWSVKSWLKNIMSKEV